ncbi:DUF4333 domain-containing protein [Blastococcus sp. SYSU DS0617]
MSDPQLPPAEASAAGDPQRRSHRPLYGGLALIALLLILALAIGRFLGPTLLDANAVERDIAEQFEERHGVALELSCEQEMLVASGEVYTCSGRTADREEVTIEVRIADSLDGAYTWIEV